MRITMRIQLHGSYNVKIYEKMHVFRILFIEVIYKYGFHYYTLLRLCGPYCTVRFVVSLKRSSVLLPSLKFCIRNRFLPNKCVHLCRTHKQYKLFWVKTTVKISSTPLTSSKQNTCFVWVPFEHC